MFHTEESCEVTVQHIEEETARGEQQCIKLQQAMG